MAKAKKSVLQAMSEPVRDDEKNIEVSKNWTWARLIQLYNFIDYRGKTPKKIDTGVPLVTAKNVRKGYLDYTVADFISEKEYKERQSRGVSKKGDILFTTEAPMGNVAIADLDIYSAGQRVITFQKYPHTEWINNKFYFYYIMSEWFQVQLQKQKTGSTVDGIKAEKLMRFPIPVPPANEQQRIVDRIESLFAKLDEAKGKAQEALDSFETRKEALLYKALRGELTAEWRIRNSYSMLDWTDEILGNVCVINPQKINTKNLSDDLEVSFFPMPALSEITGEITEPQTRKLAEVRQGFTNFSEGDVVFAKITPCMENGKCAVIGKLVNNIGFGTTEFFVLRCSARLSNRYLFHILRSITFRNEAKSVMAGAVGQQRVPKSFLVEYPLHLPPIAEQCEIVRILDDFFAKEAEAKAKVEATLDVIETMKKSVLAKAFRGELGTNNPEDESAEELLKRTLA